MADAQYNLSLIITANNKAIDEINKIGASVDKVKGNVVQFSESTKKVLKTVGVVATAVAGSMIAIGKSCVDAAIEIEPVKNAFQQLTDSVGESSDEMLKSLREASKGAVKDYDLMLAANTSMKLGVATNTEDMTQLMKIARLYGQQMGEDTSQAFDDIVRGLGRGSAQILDNLGIVVDSEKAYEDYAKQIGKTTKQLTDAEKKQAIVNATLVEGQKALEQFGEPLPTMGERIAALQNQFEGIKVKLGEALLPIVEKLMNIITPIIERISERINTHSELAAKIGVAITVVAGLVAALSGLALILPTITTAIGVLTGPVGIVIAAIGLLATARAKDRGGIREKTQEVVDFIKPYIQELGEWLRQFREEHGQQIMAVLSALRSLIQDTLAVAFEWLKVAFENAFLLLGAIFKVFKGDWKGAREDLKTMTVNIVNALKNTVETLFGGMRDTVKEFTKNAIHRIGEKLQNLLNKFVNFVNKIISAYNSVADVLGLNTKRLIPSVDLDRGGALAKGGPVELGKAYLVGEQGPELFVPNQGGKIVSNSELGGAGGIEINVNMGGVSISNDVEVNSMAERVGEVIMRQLELYQKGIR